MTVRELIDKRLRLVQQARALVENARDESRSLTSEERDRFDTLHDEADVMREQIQLEERQQAREGQQAEAQEHEDRERRRRVRDGIDAQTPEEQERREASMFTSWIRGGLGSLSTEQRTAMQARFEQLTPEMRALAAGTDSAGGYTVPEGFMAQLEEAMLNWGGMFEAADMVQTDSGNPLPWPTEDDTANKGARVAENNAVTEQDVVFSEKVLNAYMYTSKIVRVSIQLLQDSAFNIDSHLQGVMATRIGRIVNAECTTGTGSSQPNGIVSAAADSAITFTASTITRAKLLDVEHTVNRAYRRNARWMFPDSVLKLIKAVDIGTTDARPLWMPGANAGDPDTVNGYPYTINDDMADAGTSSNKFILFGDTKKYKIRRVRAAQLLRLSERWAEYLQVGFLMFARYDGEMLAANATTYAPVKYGSVA